MVKRHLVVMQRFTRPRRLVHMLAHKAKNTVCLAANIMSQHLLENLNSLNSTNIDPLA